MEKIKLNIQMFASTNKTTNYELPQFVGTDRPTWLGDFNEAMFDIDAGMHENASDIATMQSDVASASATASQASQDVAGLTSTVNTLSSNVSAVTTTANNAQSTATSALNTANTANGKADTNAGKIGDLSNLTTTDKTSAVNAINEVNGHIARIDGFIMWTNPNPTTPINTLDIDLSAYDYNVYSIIWKTTTTNDLQSDTGMIMAHHGTILLMNDNHYRVIDATSTGIHLNNAVNESRYAIPLYIIGYKTDFFS